jgi:type I restriction enzyme S subunit
MSDLPNQTEAIPSGWKFRLIREFAKTGSGGTPRRDHPAYYGGDVPWVKSGELGDRVLFETEENITDLGLRCSGAKIFPKGTLCIALYGATVGKLGILGIEAATNQAVCGIFLPPDIDTKFLFRFLEFKRRDLIGQGRAERNPTLGPSSKI